MSAGAGQNEIGLVKVGRGGRERAKDLFIIGLLLALPLVYFWRVVTPDPSDRASIARGDFIEVFYPFRRFVSDEFWAGRLPLWNPYLYGGQPGLADIQEGALYPPSLVTISLAGRQGLPVKALEWEVIFHFSLAGIFTYLFTYRLLGSRFGAMVAALAFAYGGYLTSFPVTQLGILETAIWLPLVLYFLDWGLERGTKFFLLAGFFWAFSLLAGHPQTSMYLLYTCLAFLVYGYAARRRELGLGRFLARVLLFLASGLGLAAVQLVPALELMNLSQRAEVSYSFTQGGFSLAELAAFIVPIELGGLALYVGILPLVLAALAVFLDHAHRQRFLWLGLALFSLLASLGGSTFFYSVLHLALPGYGRVRNQERGILIFAFAMAVLAGYGARYLAGAAMDRGVLARFFRLLAKGFGWLLILAGLLYYGWVSTGRELGRLVSRYNFSLLILAFAIGLIYLRLKEALRGPGFKCLLLACLVLDLFTTSWSYNLVAPEEDYFPLNTSLEMFLSDGEVPFRIQSEGLLPHDGNASMVYRLEDLTGNSPLHLEAYNRFLEEVADEWTWWQLFGVKYALSRRYMGREGMTLPRKDGDVYLYQVTEPLPRAFLVEEAWPARSEQEALALLNQPDFDPRKAVVLEGEVGRGMVAPTGVNAPSQVDMVHRSPQRLALQVEASREAFLVLSQRHYPGWRATVDGREVPILKANAIFQALKVPPGKHRVELAYMPLSFKLGGGVSSASLVSLASFLLWEAFYSRRAGKAVAPFFSRRPYFCRSRQ